MAGPNQLIAILQQLINGQVAPKYEVEKLPEDHVTMEHRVHYRKVEQGDKTILERVETDEPIYGGYMVYTMRGDSLFVKDFDMLRRLGFDGDPSLVHEDGEELDIGSVTHKSLKALSAAKTRHVMRSAATA